MFVSPLSSELFSVRWTMLDFGAGPVKDEVHFGPPSATGRASLGEDLHGSGASVAERKRARGTEEIQRRSAQFRQRSRPGHAGACLAQRKAPARRCNSRSSHRENVRAVVRLSVALTAARSGRLPPTMMLCDSPTVPAALQPISPRFVTL